MIMMLLLLLMMSPPAIDQARRLQSRRDVADTIAPAHAAAAAAAKAAEAKAKRRPHVASGLDAEFPCRVCIVDRGVDCRDPVCRYHFRFPDGFLLRDRHSLLEFF